VDPVITLWSYYHLEVRKPTTSNACYNVNPVLVQTWFPAGSILPNEALFDAAVRELFENTGLTLTVDDLTLLSGNHVRVPLPARQ
jgi:hypothetical protein